MLERLFEQLWNRVRQANLYSGQPQTALSRESLAVARVALDLAGKVQHQRLLAEAWCMMAYALNANENYSESLPYYRQAIRALESAGDEDRAARVRLGFISALSTTGQSTEAIAASHEAGRVFRAQSNLRGLARLSTNLGAVYQRLDDHERALFYHTEAAGLFKETGDERGLAQAYMNLGNTLCFVDRFADSEEMYANCESAASRLGMQELLGQSRYNKAYLYFLSGRLSEAVAEYRDARPVFLNSGSLRHAALCDLDEAEIYVQLCLPRDALVLAERAAESFSKLDMPYERGKAMAFGAVALTQKRRFGDALSAFSSAQSLLDQDGNAFWSALLDLYRAEVLFSVRRLWEAHSLASAADSKFKELGFAAKRLVALVLLGRVSMELGRLDDAEFYAATVHDLAEQANTPLFLFACHALSAEIAEYHGRLDQALEFYERAAREIETRHTHLRHDELGITFYKSKAEVFESLAYLTLALDAAAPKRSYAWCEKAKSQSFVNALAPHLQSVRSHASEALLARVERIRGELNSSYLRFRPEFLGAPGPPRNGRIELKEDELVRALGELSDSEYVSLQSASSVAVEELQQSLPEDTTVVEYFFARDEVLAFLIAKNRFRAARQLTPVKRVQYLAGRLQFQLRRFLSVQSQAKPGNPDPGRATDDLMRQFYDELVAPIIGLIETGSIVIVPHGLLHRAPFHAFHDGRGCLSDRFAISYAPSGSILKYCLDREPAQGVTPVIVSSRPDARVISGMPGARVFMEKDASREAVVRASANARFVHLDVPLALRQDNPVLSGFELADGTVSIPDIYSSRFDTNMLSLSMDRPFVDVAREGDDLMGLLRALLYAGSRSVLFELWKIREEPANIFFSGFYSAWSSGKSKREAMRAAAAAVRSAYPHTIDWAPFVLTGQP